ALYEEGRWLGLAHDMRENFGLRAKESLLSNEIKGNRLIVKGAKGGRPRSVEILTEKQWETIDGQQIVKGLSRKDVAEELGHGREEVVSHYVSIRS
ncbi:hypothetical protein ADUPG1_001195, partial [Aduncisulcus paluster]